MCVSEDKKQAVLGWYRILNGVNMPYSRIRLQGLEPRFCYHISVCGTERKETYYGDELMHLGLITSDTSAGELPDETRPGRDFDSRIYVLDVVPE